MVSYRLLAVDDEPLALSLIQRVFAAEADVDLRVATSPVKGLEIAERQDLDVVISDQRMPEMSGLAFLARIRDIRPRGHRILLTAYADMEVALHAINDGLVYRFVLKPWDLDDMRVSIRRALQAKRLADEHERLTAPLSAQFDELVRAARLGTSGPRSAGIRRDPRARRPGDEHERLTPQLSAQFDELVRAERLATIGRLSAGIGHELANAATPLLMNVELLGDELVRLHEAFRAAEHAVDSGFNAKALDRLALVTRRLQARKSDDFNETLAALRAAGTQIHSLVQVMKRVAREAADPVPYDVTQAVLSAASLLGHRFKTGIRLERDLRALPSVRCRAAEIAQVVLNLLGNAADAVEGSKLRTVRVRTWQADGRVHVEISDTGGGIDPAVRARLFEPFVTTKEIGKGTGLGLSICKNIIESHGGSISVDSEQGKGARFTFALPAAA